MASVFIYNILPLKTSRKKNMTIALAVAVAVGFLPAASAAIFTHSWDTVNDLMGMHGKFSADAIPSDEAVKFIADRYAGMATIGCGCGKENSTMEADSVHFATRIKAVNPAANVGMYYRSDMALELAQCSSHSAEWNSHPEWWLKDDKGNYIKEHGSTHVMDFSNPECADFFAGVYLSVLNVKLASGNPAVDYIYMDGAGCSDTEYRTGIGPTRSRAICGGKMAMIATPAETGKI
jgi:hypothetical protein